MPHPTYDQTRITLLLAVLAAAAISDLRTGRIFNWITYPAALIGFGLAWIYAGWSGVADAMAGLLIGLLPLLVAFLVGGSGGGDAKLMAAVGTLAHFDLTLHTLVYGLIVGAMMGIVTMIWRGQALATLGRVGRAVGVVLLGRKPADPTPPGGAKVRLGVAICLGGCWAIAERALDRSLWDALVSVIA